MTTPTHKLATRRIRLDRLTPYAHNPRRGNVAAIAESLATVGQYRPIVVNAGTLTGRLMEVLAGNHTLAAASQLGWSSLLCVTVDVGEEEAARIVAADNRTADLGSYDDAELLALLEGLPSLEGTGYADSDLAELAAATRSPVSLTDPDDVPSLDETPVVTAVGDVWELGPHRLVVGDAQEPGVWEALLASAEVAAVWTDPPYGVAIASRIGTSGVSSSQARADGREQLVNDDLDQAALEAFLRATLTHAYAATRVGGAWYVAAPHGPIGLAFSVVLTELGVWRHSLVWVKDSLVLGRSDYHYRHEPIYYGWKPGAAHRWFADRKQDTVLQYARPRRSAEHPTMKPVDLIADAVQAVTTPGDLVLDLFAGSGSTLIACHQTGRVARLVELDPRYADVICRRWQAHTGQLPTRDGQPVDFLEGA